MMPRHPLASWRRRRHTVGHSHRHDDYLAQFPITLGLTLDGPPSSSAGSTPMRNEHINTDSLGLLPKRQKLSWDDDQTSTMMEKRRAMNAGIHLNRPINYTPAEKRTPSGIAAGVIGGIAIFAFCAVTALALYRAFGG